MKKMKERKIVEIVLLGIFITLFIIYCFINKSDSFVANIILDIIIILFIIIIIYSAILCYFKYTKK